MWLYPGVSLILWKPGDLVKVCASHWNLDGPGLIISIRSRRGSEWYDILINGKIEPMMWQDLEPYVCKLKTHSV